jgi:conjugative transposon TraM protein
MTQKNQKKLKLLKVLPLFVVPVAALLFFIFNIGNNKSKSEVNNADKQSAFNSNLPAVNLKETGKNKLEIYMAAERDSLKRKEQLLKDPYEKTFFDPAPPEDIQKERLEKTRLAIQSPPVDPNEKKVNDRLNKLLNELNKTGQESTNVNTTDKSMPNEEISRLENLMSAAHEPSTSTDPEISRLDKMLDKILDIQNPDRIKKENEQFPAPIVSPVSVVTSSPVNSYENGFYGLQEDDPVELSTERTTIQAVVHEQQTVQDNSKVKLRLLQDLYINSNRIPKGNFVWGLCSIADERVQIAVKSIAFGNTIYTVNLIVYDIDGLVGVSAPGAVTNEVTKNSINQSLQNMELYSADPSIAAKAASAGVLTLKNLLSRNTKKVNVTLKANYVILLRVNQ